MEIIPLEALFTLIEVDKNHCDPRLQPIINVYRKRLYKIIHRKKIAKREITKKDFSFESMDEHFTIYEIVDKEKYGQHTGDTFENARVYIFKMFDKYTSYADQSWRISQYPDHNPQGSGHVDNLITASIMVHEKIEATYNCSTLIDCDELLDLYPEVHKNDVVFGQKVTVTSNEDGTITCSKMTWEEIAMHLDKREKDCDRISYSAGLGKYVYTNERSKYQAVVSLAQNHHSNDPKRHKKKESLRYGVIILSNE